MNLYKKIMPFGALAAAALFVSCDNIAPEDRLIPVDRVHSDKVVLIQEFSGQNCTFCPEGASVIHGLLNTYDDQLAVVTMHPYGSEQSEQLGPINLRNELSTDYFKYYGSPSAFPAAIIDATPYEGTLVLTSRGTWADAVINQFKLETAADLSVASDYDDATRTLTVNYNVKMTKAVSESLSIVVWLTESGIVAQQRGPTGVQRKYVHDHILRASFNGTWGTVLADSFLPEEKFDGTLSLKLPEDWVAENCEVVAAVFATGSKTVYQAAKTPAVK